uniref:Uncharacterized protein n=1 Tax=Arundo donax TaxID=35708 RepID=A0A0A9ALQ5_ARUDO
MVDQRSSPMLFSSYQHQVELMASAT